MSDRNFLTSADNPDKEITAGRIINDNDKDNDNNNGHYNDKIYSPLTSVAPSAPSSPKYFDTFVKIIYSTLT